MVSALSGIERVEEPGMASLPPAAPYWMQAREPLPCLIFLLPLLVIYEAGVLWFGHGQAMPIRNGADHLMRTWLLSVGVDAFALPALVVGGLLGWHRYGAYPWRISRETLVGMFAESLLFAVLLLMLAQLQDMVFQCLLPDSISIREAAPGDKPLLAISSGLAPQLISFVGAGVYEEVMFRLTLLPLSLIVLTRGFQMPRHWAAVLAVFLTSLVFSVAHNAIPGGEAFSLFTFTFRILAGCFFGTLFLLRGFGITVGCHALYDILVGLLTLT